MKKLRYSLTIHGDYIVDSGLSSPRGADNAVLRTTDGVPYIPWSSVRGLVRDACEGLCRVYVAAKRDANESVEPTHPLWGCNGEYDSTKPETKLCGVNARVDEEKCLICRLFGRPGGKHTGALMFGDATLPADVASLLNPKSAAWTDSQVAEQVIAELNRDQERLQTQNQHDPILRRGRDDALFTLESVAPLGGLFEGDIWVRPGHLGLSELEQRVLVASLCAVKELGGKRRRGHGDCAFSVRAPNECVDIAKKGLWTDLWGKSDDELRQLNTRPARERSQAASERSAGTITLDVVIKASNELTLTAGQWAGNLAATQDFVSGSRLRGALAELYFGSGVAWDDVARRLFFSPETRFENCYPCYPCAENSASAAAPIPLSALTCKAAPGFAGEELPPHHGVQDALLKRPDRHKGTDICVDKAPLERLEGNYYDPTSEMRVMPGRRQVTRTALENGRAKAGALFTKEGVERGTQFAGAITIDGALWKRFKQVTSANSGGPVTILLGSAGVAAVDLSEREAPADAFPWPLAKPFSERCKDGCRRFTLTLWSDAILLDDFGAPLVTIGAQWLCGLLGLSPCAIERDERFVQSVRRIAGWNRKVGLPAQTDVALARGSCYVFCVKANGDLEDVCSKLEQLEKKGIGLRRNEGFGRIVINDPFHTGFSEPLSGGAT